MSADFTSDAAIARLKAAMPKISAAPVDSRFARHLQEVLTPPTDRESLPSPAPKVITQADIDREVTLLRAAKARRESENSGQTPDAGDPG